jgi:hypothetical protein
MKPPQDNQFFPGNSFLSANGKVAGVVNTVGGVRLWETDTGKQIMDRKQSEWVQLFFSAALSPDGQSGWDAWA